MSFTGHEDQKIKFEDGAELTKRYRDNNPSGCQLGEYFSKDSILELLNQPGCVGIRVYFGYDESKIFKLVNRKMQEFLGPGATHEMTANYELGLMVVGIHRSR